MEACGSSRGGEQLDCNEQVHPLTERVAAAVESRSPSKKMNLYKSHSQVKTLIDQLKPDTLLSVTAPLYVDESIIICIYSDLLGIGCVHVPINEFEPVRALLYEPKGFHLAVHGLKRIWEQFGLDDYEIQPG